MDILDSLAADHRRMRHALGEITDELGRYLRARPAAARRLRSNVARYIDYAARVHEPREHCLRDYLRERGTPMGPFPTNERAAPGAWQDLLERLRQPLGSIDRLALRRRLAVLIRDSEDKMAQEEQALFAAARQGLSALERHALALRAIIYRPAGGAHSV